VELHAKIAQASKVFTYDIEGPSFRGEMQLAASPHVLDVCSSTYVGPISSKVIRLADIFNGLVSYPQDFWLNVLEWSYDHLSISST
jgi:hypothetical protein